MADLTPTERAVNRLRTRRAAGCSQDNDTGLLLAGYDQLEADAQELRAHLRVTEKHIAEQDGALAAIRHLHLDSPMGPCPTCLDGDDLAAGGDGLHPYPCKTARLAGATDCVPTRTVTA